MSKRLRKQVAHHREDAEWDIVVPAGAKHRPECGKGRYIMKKKDFRRGISVLLAAVMLLGTISVEGLAVHAEEQDETWEDTGLLVNGDFEDGDNGWTVSGGNAGCKVENNTYATNNTTNYYHIYAEENTEFVLQQIIQDVAPGTYKVEMEQEGHTMASGLSIQVGDTTEELPATTGWDQWSDYTSEEIVIEEAADLTIALTGTIQAGYWGDFDNFVLLKKTAVTEEPGDDSEEISWKDSRLLDNGDFEEATDSAPNAWAISFSSGEDGTYGYTAKTDQWAKNNKTQMLNLWNNSTSQAAEVAIRQTVAKAPAGRYYLSFGLEGVAAQTDMKVKINDVELAFPATTGWDVWQTVATPVFTLTEETELTIEFSGAINAGYWMDLDDVVLHQEEAEEVPDPVEAEIYVERVENLSDDFIGGVDVSSYVSLKNSGVKYYDFAGNELDDQGFFNLLAESGINYVRIRVWNAPYDANGNGYGGGNNDLATAVRIGQWATRAGMRVLIDFHYSDFWADPDKQQAPKAWQGLTLEEKLAEVTTFTENSIQTLLDSNVNVGMVQVGNETNNGIAGESSWSEGMLKVFAAGCDAVHTVANENNHPIKAVLHFANPEKGTYVGWAKKLAEADVEYDVFASSYYPYWHGTLSNLQSQLDTIAKTYGKEVMVAETSWATTLEDGDGHDNTVRDGNNDTDMPYDFSIYGQAKELREVINTIADTTNGIGVFYWEPAWLPVQVYDADADNAEEVLQNNRAAWERYGSGWAASYAGEYDAKDAGKWYGGSAVDNQALFDFSGHPLDTLNIFKYVKTGATTELKISVVKTTTAEAALGEEISLPEKVTVTYSDGTSSEREVTWNAEQIKTAQEHGAGNYRITGVVVLNEKEYEAVCRLTISPENLLTDGGFENGTGSAWIIDGSGVGIKADSSNVRKGTYCLHFWADTEMNYTVTQTMTLKTGAYTFGGYLEGKTKGTEDTYEIYVSYNGQEQTAAAEMNGWQNWSNPEIKDITITKDDTEIVLGIRVKASAEAWGAWDDMYLYKTGEVEPEPTESPAPSATPEPAETPAPSATPEPTETPVPSGTPEPAGTPAPTTTPAPTEDSSSDSNTPVQKPEVDWNAVNSNVQDKVNELVQNTNINSVNMNIVCAGETQVPVNVLEAIKGSNVTLALHSGNGVAVSISGQDLKGTAGNALQKMDLTVNSASQNIPAAVVAAKNADAAKQLSVKDSGAFPVTVNIHVNVGSENSGKFANLYRYNAEKKQLEYCGTFPVTRNGQSMFALKRGGDYVVTVTATQPRETVYFTSGDYMVKAGDTLSAIAARNHMSLAELKARNPQVRDLHKIRVGQKLNLN